MTIAAQIQQQSLFSAAQKSADSPTKQTAGRTGHTIEHVGTITFFVRVQNQAIPVCVASFQSMRHTQFT